MNEPDAALLELLARLRDGGYAFVTPSPATHQRVVARRDGGRDLRDIFGWSLPFERAALPGPLLGLLDEAGMLAAEGGSFRSLIRVSSLGGKLFVHSAYPTERQDAVFFGPDSYRFVRFVLGELAAEPAERLVDVGAGAGVGAILAMRAGGVREALLTDTNPLALRFARINARHAGAEAEFRLGSGLENVPRGLPLAIMNPPFIADEAGRAYRDGGGALGAGLSLDWALAAARLVAPGGRVLLYTGSAIAGGGDGLEQALRAGLPPDCSLRYEEIDPDIFGEELERPAYAEAERIAAIGAVIRRAG
jgi:methylase of polypeptide subunit release factors